jgi:hypothetical protein
MKFHIREAIEEDFFVGRKFAIPRMSVPGAEIRKAHLDYFVANYLKWKSQRNVLIPVRPPVIHDRLQNVLGIQSFHHLGPLQAHNPALLTIVNRRSL